MHQELVGPGIKFSFSGDFSGNFKANFKKIFKIVSFSENRVEKKLTKERNVFGWILAWKKWFIWLVKPEHFSNHAILSKITD